MEQETVLETGPIYLDQLLCTESDTELLSCQSGLRAPGLVTCDHSEDVWIRCIGTYSSAVSLTLVPT